LAKNIENIWRRRGGNNRKQNESRRFSDIGGAVISTQQRLATKINAGARTGVLASAGGC
jgi:hypothetical protein